MTVICVRFRRWLGAVVIGLLLIGCAMTGGWNPGEPDAATIEHYALVQAAIAAKSIDDALAALFLLRSDINRIRNNAPEMMATLARFYEVNRAVDKGDWDAARVRLMALRANYGRRSPRSAFAHEANPVPPRRTAPSCRSCGTRARH